NDPTNEIDSDDDSGDGFYSLITRSGDSALAPGTYYVRVNEFGGDDVLSSYNIRVTASGASNTGDAYEPDDTAALASVISTDGTRQYHSFHVGTDVDWVQFTLTSTTNVTIETDG